MTAGGAVARSCKRLNFGFLKKSLLNRLEPHGSPALRSHSLILSASKGGAGLAADCSAVNYLKAGMSFQHTLLW